MVKLPFKSTIHLMHYAHTQRLVMINISKEILRSKRTTTIVVKLAFKSAIRLMHIHTTVVYLTISKAIIRSKHTTVIVVNYCLSQFSKWN